MLSQSDQPKSAPDPKPEGAPPPSSPPPGNGERKQDAIPDEDLDEVEEQPS